MYKRKEAEPTKAETVSQAEEAKQEPAAAVPVVQEPPKIDVAALSGFLKEYANIGKVLAAFMVKFEQYKFDMIQAENRMVNMRDKLRLAEMELGRVEREAQTRLDSVNTGHRALVEQLTAEKIELQKKASDLEKKSYELDRLKSDYERLCIAANSKVRGLNELAAAGK